jgi:hypothetical protein
MNTFTEFLLDNQNRISKGLKKQKIWAKMATKQLYRAIKNRSDIALS